MHFRKRVVKPLHLTIPTPGFDHPIVEDIIALERWKSKTLGGTTHPAVFADIKQVYHLLESLGSARIEGNRTTIDELVDAAVNGVSDSTEGLREISNLEDAMSWIESVFAEESHRRIDHSFLQELHRLTVKNLRPPEVGGEGDPDPGRYRSSNVAITGTSFVPPPGWEVQELMDRFITFINEPIDVRRSLMRIAIAHHRCAAIHPFRNGNGRLVRLLTYAMLIRDGYRIDQGRIINPTAVFCHNRADYMDGLSDADDGTEASSLRWCAFVLSGLRRELEKVGTLLDANILGPRILQPTIRFAVQSGHITDEMAQVLSRIAKYGDGDASTYRSVYPGKSAASISHIIADHKQIGIIAAYPTIRSRRYVARFSGPALLTALIHTMDAEGYLPFRRDDRGA